MCAMIAADDPRLVWSGAVSLERGEGWIQPWRCFLDKKPLYYNEGLIGTMSCSSGVRIRFATDAESCALETEPMYANDRDQFIDVCAEDEIVCSVKWKEGDTSIEFSGLPAGMKTVEIWLPSTCPTRVRGVTVPDSATFEKSDDTRPKWITYGSSISQCHAATGSARIWPAVASRAKGLNLTSLGFSGQCHFDPLVGCMIRDLPADVISLKLGINVYSGSLSERTFGPGVIGLISLIREKHENTPLVIVSPIFSPERETTLSQGNLTLVKMREAERGIVDLFRARGDENIYYVDGLKIFDSELASEGLLPDNLHPNGDGYVRMGENFLEEVFGGLSLEV